MEKVQNVWTKRAFTPKIFTCIVHLMLYKLIQIPKEKLNNNQGNQKFENLGCLII